MTLERDENGGLKAMASDEARAGEFVRDGDGALLGLMNGGGGGSLADIVC